MIDVFSLAELNAAIRDLVTELNDRVTRHLGASRRALFALKAHVNPDNYRADLLAALHAYVNDPTNIRDAYVSDPAIKLRPIKSCVQA